MDIPKALDNFSGDSNSIGDINDIDRFEYFDNLKRKRTRFKW